MIYLLQRATIRRPLVNAHLSHAVDFDYMGSSEFEWGALPKSLRAMESVAGELKLVAFPEIRREDGQELIGYGVFDDERRTAYVQALLEVAERKRRCKEFTNLPEAIQPSRNLPAYATRSERERKDYLARLTNFWWDIDNHVMFSFDNEFMERLPAVLRKSWDKMNGIAPEAEPETPPVSLPNTSGQELVVQRGKDYDGRVVTKLRNGRDGVHSLLVDIGGKVGRLPITSLKGTPKDRASRHLRKGDCLTVRVVHIDPRTDRFVLTER